MDTTIKVIDEESAYIAIPLKEYKELLMIKGKYEELKSQQKPAPWTVKTVPLRTDITYTTPQWEPDDRKVTCEE